MIFRSAQRKDPKGWDQVIIDGMVLPGQSKVTELSRERAVEQKKIPGAHGEDLDIKSVKSPEIAIETRLWTDQQYEESVAIFQKLDPLPGKEKAKVLSIDCAPLRARNIGYIVITKVDGPKQDGQFTTWKITARGREKPNANNVGLGPPAGQTCEQLQQEYAFRRDDYMRSKYKAQNAIPSLRAEQLAGIGTDEERARQIELKIREFETQIANKRFYLRQVRDRMMQKGCKNTPPDVES